MSLASLQSLPIKNLMESPKVLNALVNAHRYLAELKGIAKTIPNESILISILSLQEAQSSSAIENIITTQDELYKYGIQKAIANPATKEVAYYAEALRLGYNLVKQQGQLTLNSIIDLQACLEGNRAEFRKLTGTTLRNERTGEIVFEPPPPEKVPAYMSELEKFINEDQGIDPLVSMALIHHQFETIHPFYDGNGRTGRIINILYLVMSDLLDTPILYLSRYINQTKDDYYQELQNVRSTGEWGDWVVYMLKGIASTAKHTTNMIDNIRDLLFKQKNHIRENHKFYSQDLINNLFRHPYTKIAFIEQDLKVSRTTATRYLDALAKDGILKKQKMGRENYYINLELVDLLFNTPEL